MLSVGAVRPLAPAAPLGGPVSIKDCQLHVDSKDDILSMGASAPLDGPEMRCARLDDFDWVVPHYEPNMLLFGRDMEVGITDIDRDIRVLPDVFPVLPVVVETGPQFDCDMDILLSGRDIEVEITDIGRDIRVLPDVCPVMFDETAAVPLSLPVVVETEPLFFFRSAIYVFIIFWMWIVQFDWLNYTIHIQKIMNTYMADRIRYLQISCIMWPQICF